MSKTWRDHAAPIIAKVLKDTEGKTEKEIQHALRNAYPYGERAHHPYKIWLDEIKVQRDKRKFGERKAPIDPNQTNLF